MKREEFWDALKRDFLSFHCAACGVLRCEPCHIKSRGSGGEATYENILPLCRIHHDIQGWIGWTRMANSYPNVKKELVKRGWEYDETRKKWTRPAFGETS